MQPLRIVHAMSGVLDNRSGHSTDSSLADKNGARVVFNEQTNYVPKRTIITVSLAAENSLQYLIMTRSFWLVPASICWR